jgi:hypothetical protein
MLTQVLLLRDLTLSRPVPFAPLLGHVLPSSLEPLPRHPGQLGAGGYEVASSVSDPSDLYAMGPRS